MCLLPGNPFSQAVEACRDSGEALCSKGMQAVTPPFKLLENGPHAESYTGWNSKEEVYA